MTNKIINTVDDLPLSKELLEGLEKLFPERCPTIDMTDREIWIYAGKCRLVTILRAAYDRQQRQHINDPLHL